MSSGGSRNRSGPASDPNSARSERRGLKFTALPAEGYDGPAPDFPLPKRRVVDTFFVEGVRMRQEDEAATEQIAYREAELWSWAWSLPQAAAWAQPSESWRLHTIAMWVRTYVICEGSEATAADKSSLHRFADQIGLTPAGLKENGWAIAANEVAAKAADRAVPAEPAAPRKRRLRAVPGE